VVYMQLFTINTLTGVEWGYSSLQLAAVPCHSGAECQAITFKVSETQPLPPQTT
jgi:hypothetical protein